VVDVVGVVEHAFPVGSITVKNGPNTGKQINKRSIKLVDKSARTVELTLWDDFIEQVTEEHAGAHAVVAIRAVRVSDFGGPSLSTTCDTSLELNPDLPEAFDLRRWYDEAPVIKCLDLGPKAAR